MVFTWRGVLLALGVMSFPLLVRSTRVAFEGVNPRLEQIARTLGAGNFRVFCTITVPLAGRGIVGGMLPRSGICAAYRQPRAAGPGHRSKEKEEKC